MGRDLKIQIIGNSNSGKSNIALLIKDTLAIHGIDVQINEHFEEEITEEELRKIRPEALKSIKEGYEGRTIQLDVKHSNTTHPTESKKISDLTIGDLLKLPPIFQDNFTCPEDVYNHFCVNPAPGEKILYAWYETPPYEGYAEVLYTVNGKLYYVTGSHCSCHGLEDQWTPEEITLKELNHYYKNGGEKWNGLREFLNQIDK